MFTNHKAKMYSIVLTEFTKQLNSLVIQCIGVGHFSTQRMWTLIPSFLVYPTHKPHCNHKSVLEI